MPDSTRTAEMIRTDMAAAAIPKFDASGRKRDFHSLRHTTGSFLNDAGVNPKVAQAVLGHSSVELTMGIYTHTYRDDEAQAVAALPRRFVDRQ
jgi:integrase